MKALTLQQPYASAMAVGPKRIENRVWRRSLPPGGVWYGLHAGLSLYKGCTRGQMVALGWTDCPEFDELPRGALLGVVHVAEIQYYRGAVEWPYDGRSRRIETNPWAFGPWCWRVDDVRLLPTPLPCRGAVGLWQVPAEHEPLLTALVPAPTTLADLNRESP